MAFVQCDRCQHGIFWAGVLKIPSKINAYYLGVFIYKNFVDICKTYDGLVSTVLSRCI